MMLVGWPRHHIHSLTSQWTINHRENVEMKVFRLKNESNKAKNKKKFSFLDNMLMKQTKWWKEGNKGFGGVNEVLWKKVYKETFTAAMISMACWSAVWKEKFFVTKTISKCSLTTFIANRRSPIGKVFCFHIPSNQNPFRYRPCFHFIWFSWRRK